MKIARGFVLGCGILGLAHVSCGGPGDRGGLASTTGPAAPSDAEGSAAATSVPIPESLRSTFAQLPAAARSRFERLPLRRQQHLLARLEGLPPAATARLVKVAQKSGFLQRLEEGEANTPPVGVFNTIPAARDGVISGDTPLTVFFGMCNFEDPDPGDVLKYKYDVLGTGEFERGICKKTVTYPDALPACFTARVCVSDRQPDHDVCAQYLVCPGVPYPPRGHTSDCGTFSRGSFTGTMSSLPPGSYAGPYYSSGLHDQGTFSMPAGHKVNSSLSSGAYISASFGSCYTALGYEGASTYVVPPGVYTYNSGPLSADSSDCYHYTSSYEPTPAVFTTSWSLTCSF